MIHEVFSVYLYAVPALHKDPDIQILDINEQTQFTLIEHDQMYDCKWNPEELNEDDYDESSEIKFSIENWLFQINPMTKVPLGWVPRHELPRQIARNQFAVLHTDTNAGSFSFKQTTNSFSKIQFGISLVVVKKQTKNLNISYSSSLLSFVPDVLDYSGKNAIKEFCRMWRAKTDEIVILNDMKSCPCTLESARMDPDLNVDFTCSSTEPDCHENVKAHRCFLFNLTT